MVVVLDVIMVVVMDVIMVVDVVVGVQHTSLCGRNPESRLLR